MVVETNLRCPEPNKDLLQLEEGQHVQMPISIKVAAKMGYHHHAVVEDVTETKGGKILVNLIGRGEYGITRDVFAQDERSVELVRHADPKYTYSETYERAVAKLKALGRKDKYNLVTNNCEHFAEWCVEGVARCLQIENMNWFTRKFIENIGDKLFWGAKYMQHGRHKDDDEIAGKKCKTNNTQITTLFTIVIS